MALIVKKFGGTSVGSIDRINAVADYLSTTTSNGDRCICVVSAMAGQTNDLLKQATALSPQPPKREVDMLLTVGERISMSLLSIALHHRGVSAISLTGSQCGILTDQTHGNARIGRILGDRIRSSLLSNRVVIVAGFQGMNPETKDITTLGRGGTDLTAVAVARALAADQCDIYTDVSGVYTADPRRVESARCLEQVAWSTVVEMAWAGAKVVHPRAAHMANKFRIPVRIKNSFAFADEGTLMTEQPMEGPIIEAITERFDRVYVEGRLTKPKSILGDLTAWLWDQGEPAGLCSQSVWGGEQTIRAVVDKNIIGSFAEWLKSQSAEVTATTPIQILTIIGQGFLQSPEVLQRALALIDQVPVATETSNHAINMCLSKPLSKADVTKIHDDLITDEGSRN